MIGRAACAIALVALFLKAMFLSGLQTAGLILRTGLGAGAPPTAIARYRFAEMSPLGAVILGCLITLTPGTTTLEIDMERREMLLHFLDARDLEGAAASIRRDLERPVAGIFGRRP